MTHVCLDVMHTRILSYVCLIIAKTFDIWAQNKGSNHGKYKAYNLGNVLYKIIKLQIMPKLHLSEKQMQ